MKLYNCQILAIGRILVLLFFLANSGFTVILYRCTMEKMDCCRASEDSMSAHCSMMDLPQASGGLSVRADNNCNSVIIAGGLKSDPTVVEKEFAARLPKTNLIAAFNPDFGLSMVSPQFQFLSSTVPPDVSPPSVQKYVFNSTFLI